MDDHGMVEYDKVSINECDRYHYAFQEYFEVDYEDEDEDDDWDY